MQIGPYILKNNLILSPMAGITDRPFRQLCREHGAGLAVSEMTASNPALRNNHRTQLKMDHAGEDEPRSVQIVGTNPSQMAEAAQYNQANGAQIIDINMGCPAKKVCNVAAGSALLRDENLVQEILQTVVSAVDIPVTLKIRTGWDRESKNAETIARIAEQAGIQALAIHGRTRACKYNGDAEFDTIKAVKKAVTIPVFANGDITTPERARDVLQQTGADGLLIGRGAQGKPWIFREIDCFLKTGQYLAAPTTPEIHSIIKKHLIQLHHFYGDVMGVKIARKHIRWYFNQLNGQFLTHIKECFLIQEPQQQLDFIDETFYALRKYSHQAA
ncbi:MAG: tRNA dihydrouridine synthase DusB [Cycloclasticus sp.]|nr:MAG: tRNA dihydrouridine synthase DusB [Cycloclasticus sp.]